MDVVFEAMIIIIGSSIGLVTLGLVTGFSPVLYIAQVAAAAKSQTPTHAMRSLILGVLVGALFLGLLFLFFQPGTLAFFFSSTFGPIIISSWFHVLLGLLFIGFGIRMLFTKQRIKKASVTSTQPTTFWMLFSAGFLKTVLSAGSILSVFFATQIILTSDGGPVTQLILAGVFLISTLAPFAALYIIWQKSPEKLEQKVQDALAWLEKIPYRPILAVASAAAGVLILSSTIIGI